MGGIVFWLFGGITALIAGASAALFGYWALLPVAGALVVAGAVVVWRRTDNSPRYATVTPNLVLIAMPTALASVSLSRTLGFALVAAVGLAAFAKRPNLSLSWPCLLIPVIGALIVLRPSPMGGTAAALLFLAGCVIVVRTVTISESRASAIVSLIDGVGLFLVVSVVLWAAGVAGSSGRTEGLQNSLTGDMRVIFPLSNSLAATPAMAAVYLASVLPLLALFRRYRIPRLAAALCGVGVMLLAGSRASLLAALLVAGCVLVVPKFLRAVAPWIAGIALIAPFLYGPIKGPLGGLLADSLPWLFRSSEEVLTLNRRDFIWSQAIDFYTQQSDWLHQAFGFGTFGHVTSGASTTFDAGLAGFGADQQTVTPHNSFLQYLFDGGWVLTLAFAVTLLATAWTLSRRHQSALDLTALAMLITAILTAVTEVTLSASHALPTWWVLVALGVFAFVRERDGEEDESPPAKTSAVSVASYGR